MTFCKLSQYCLKACVLTGGEILNITCALFQEIFYRILVVVFENVILQSFVCFKQLLLPNIKKFVFCGKCVVKTENSLGEQTIWHNFIKFKNNWIKLCNSVYIWLLNKNAKYGFKMCSFWKIKPKKLLGCKIFWLTLYNVACTLLRWHIQHKWHINYPIARNQLI